MSKKQNIFAASGADIFAVPIVQFDKLIAREDAKATAITLYIYLLRRAVTPTFRLHTGEILEATGMSRATLCAARQYLEAAELIRCTQDRDRTAQGFWEFEILGDDGGPLPTFDGWLDFRKLSVSEIEQFYSDRLNVSKAPQRESNGTALRFECPYHVHAEGKYPLRVTLGGDHHGRWICENSRRCGRRGGLLDFELAWARRKGQEMTRGEAARSVRRFFEARRYRDEPQPFTALPVPNLASI